ncbi:MAG: hypothetical protein ACFFAH_06205 [Promethearchaeota archaeon]
MTEDSLKAKISELETQLESKDKEIIGYLEKIEHLEDTIMRLEALIPDKVREDSKKGKKITDSKLAIDLEDKEKEIRELKNKMGFLRKEKIQVQHELEKYTKKQTNSTVIRIEEKKEPLEALVKELNLKINKQDMIIKQLKEEIKKEEIIALKLKIDDLKKELELSKSIAKMQFDDSSTTIKRLQNKLQSTSNQRKAKRLKSKLKKYESKQAKKREEFTPAYLQKKIDELRAELSKKNLKIKELKKSISTLDITKETVAPEIESKSSNGTFKGLSEDLQRKLNTARKQIRDLEEQLKEYKVWKAPVENESQQEIINELRNKLEKLRSQEQTQGKIEGVSSQVQVVVEDDINLALRVRELKNLLEDLQKRNDQQRLEISHLRKKTA